MYSRAGRAALFVIRDNIALARRFVEGLTAETFRADQRSIYAVTRCLEIMSEASRRLPDGVVERHSAVPWQRIRSAGNIYRHRYDNVSPAVLWTTVESGLDALEAAVVSEIDALAASAADSAEGEPD